MSQKVRNLIYGIASAVFLVAVTIGFFDQAAADQAQTFLETSLDIIDRIIGLVVSLVAWWNSLRRRTTTLQVPRDAVAGVITTDDYAYTVDSKGRLQGD
jgi:hypothetical protein